MAAQSIGTASGESITFNSAYLTVNGIQISDITNVVINKNFTEKDFYALNSIKARALRRSHFKVACTFDIEGGPQRQLYAMFYSASSAGGSDATYTVKDGQQNVVTVMITAYELDDTAKYYQCTLTNPLITGYDDTRSREAYGMNKIQLVATDITELISNTIAN